MSMIRSRENIFKLFYCSLNKKKYSTVAGLKRITLKTTILVIYNVPFCPCVCTLLHLGKDKHDISYV